MSRTLNSVGMLQVQCLNLCPSNRRQIGRSRQYSKSFDGVLMMSYRRLMPNLLCTSTIKMSL